MRHPVSERLKRFVRPSWYRLVYRGRPSYHCPVCGYRGPFKNKRLTLQPGACRRDSKCPNCTATERHRMLALVCNEVFKSWSPGGKSLLHFAPEPCLQPMLQAVFSTYHTADLFMPRVDFKEDLQCMSFTDCSYDAVLISHVMTSVPNMHASVRELRRVLKPGGVAIIAEAVTLEHTNEYGCQRGDFWRELGMDFQDLLMEHFSHVDMLLSGQYDGEYQLDNLMMVDGVPCDAYPEAIRIPGVGYQSVTAICRVDATPINLD